jgi:hypothetical protein
LRSTFWNSSTRAPATSTPVGPPPTTTNVRAPSSTRVGIGVGGLEALEHVVPEPVRVVEVVEREAVLVDAGDPERVGDRPGRDHEVVEVEVLDLVPVAVEVEHADSARSAPTTVA